MRSSFPGAEPPQFAFTAVKTAAYWRVSSTGRPPAKLLAVTAPTGYGKTVLLSALHEHYRRGGAQCHWLALDDRDVSVERLLAGLERLLVPPGSAVDPVQAMHQGDDPVEERISWLIDSLDLLSRPVVLFIDNLNHCTDEALRRLLDGLLFNTTSRIFLVLSSTGTLPYDQARARLEGRVQAIGPADLSLDREGIVQILGNEVCTQLAPAEIDQIARQTEGWPAAVRLTQIILKSGSPSDRMAVRLFGTDEDLAALLNRQVLRAFSPRERQFLLEISLLRTFGVNLCRFATGEAHASDYIAQLIQRNLFVIPLDRTRSWYRLHGLFREFLVHEAERELSAERRRDVLARAAEWCEHGGHTQDAIEYALNAGALPLAGAILNRAASTFVRDWGDLRKFIEWVERLRGSGAECGWEADFWYVWALVFHRRYDDARLQAARLSLRLDREHVAGETPPDIAALKRRMEVIRIAIDIYTDHPASAHELSVKWLESSENDDPFNVATVACAAGFHMSSALNPLKAHEYLRIARSHITHASSEYGAAWVGILASLISIDEGDFAGAHQDLLAALRRSKSTLGETAGINGTIALLAAKCAVEMNLENEAHEFLDLGLRKFYSHGIVETAALGLDAASKLWIGGSDEAAAIGRLRDLAAAHPPRLAVMLSCFTVRRLVRLGRVEEALREAAHIGLSVDRILRKPAPSDVIHTVGSRDLMIAAEIDLQIATGHLKRAQTLVAVQSRQAREAGRVSRMVELALDEASICLCTHNPAPAARHLSRAVSLAARRRYLRPFRDRAELVAALVNETKAKDWGFTVDEERRFFAEICHGLPQTADCLLGELDALNGAPVLLETPTARELELLSLIEAGLSNQQLADRLALSVATVKWHLYNLYSKLGVSSRSAARARGKALNLLSR